MRVKEIIFNDNTVALATDGLEVSKNGAEIAEENFIETSSETEANDLVFENAGRRLSEIRKPKEGKQYDIIRVTKDR